MKIRICTWNIGGGLVRSERNIFEVEDLSYFRRALMEIDADVVCVQEAHSGSDASEDQLALLADGLGLHQVASQALSRSHLKPATNANIGIASRLHIVEREFLELPNPQWRGQGPDGSDWLTLDKGFLSLLLERDGQRVCVVTGHDFPIRAFDRSEDDPELVAMHSGLNSLIAAKAASFPTIFTGDLNIQEPTTCLPVLAEPMFHRVIPAGPTTQPWHMQFDHIYANARFHTCASGIVPGEADHYLCWADLELQ